MSIAGSFYEVYYRSVGCFATTTVDAGEKFHDSTGKECQFSQACRRARPVFQFWQTQTICLWCVLKLMIGI